MFKKIISKFDTLYEFIQNSFRRQDEEHSQTRRFIQSKYNDVEIKLDRMCQIFMSQQRTIEQLTNALQDKYEHGLFVLSDDGSNFMLIKNGEKIANDKLLFCRVTWAPRDAVSVETEYIV